MEEQQNGTEQKSNLNPLLVVVIVIIVAAVGVMLWLGNNKNNNTQTAQQQVAPTTATTQTDSQPTGTATESAGSSMMMGITVEGGNFYFKPNEIKVKKGQKVKITFNNSGGMHNFIIDEFNVKSETINGGSTTVEFTPDKTGTFEFYCGVGMHRQMGMKGNLIVE